jgi:hypothetical protein
MKFMNSYIAEAMGGASLHYFHQEGMTVIDLLLQKTLDKGITLSDVEIMETIDTIEASYDEDDEYEEEE